MQEVSAQEVQQATLVIRGERCAAVTESMEVSVSLYKCVSVMWSAHSLTKSTGITDPGIRHSEDPHTVLPSSSDLGVRGQTGATPGSAVQKIVPGGVGAV